MLIWPSELGFDEVVQLLVDKQADIHAEGGDFGNALQAASLGGHKVVVKMLLDKGATSMLRVESTAMHFRQLASFGGHNAIIKLLLATGKVDVDSKYSDGQTLLW